MSFMIRSYFQNPTIFYAELIYSMIIIILSLLIYFKTKEMYDLTKHKGIGFFRNTFLFFSLAYFFRFSISAFDITRIAFDFQIRKYLLMPVILAIISYLSTMAIFSLLFSTIWKNDKIKQLIIVANIFAIASSVIVFFTRSSTALMISQAILLVIAIFMSYKMHKKSKKFSNLFTIYILLFVFWIVNIAILGPQRLIPLEFRILQDIISIGVFSIIVYKTLKWTK